MSDWTTIQRDDAHVLTLDGVPLQEGDRVEIQLESNRVLKAEWCRDVVGRRVVFVKLMLVTGAKFKAALQLPDDALVRRGSKR